MRKEYDFAKGRRGAVLPVRHGKTRITIRIDNDVLDWFRRQVHDAGGGSYQTLLNRALREHVARSGEPFERTIRRVLREELGHADVAPDRLRDNDDGIPSGGQLRRRLHRKR
jgi:hypothetical protein